MTETTLSTSQGDTPEGKGKSMSIDREQQPGQPVMRNAAGEVMTEQVLTNGDHVWLTDAEYTSMAEQGLIGHSREGVVREFDKTSLGDAHAQGLLTTPDSPAPLTATETEQEVQASPKPKAEKKPNWVKRAIVGTVALGAATGAVIGVAKAVGGNDEEAPSPRPTASGPAVPGGEVSPDGTPGEFEAQRAKLSARTANAAMLSPEYYEPNSTQSIDYLDQKLLGVNMRTLLDNEVYMIETGDFSALNKTFFTDGNGNYPDQGMTTYVEGLKAQHETIAEYTKQNPNYPVSEKILARIDNVQDDGFEAFTVQGVVLETTYGAPLADGGVRATKTATRMEFKIMASPHDVSEGVTETAWTILSETPMGTIDPAEEDFGQGQSTIIKP